MTSDSPSVTLHSTWWYLVASWIGSGLLAAGGTYGVATAGFRGLSSVFFVLGWGAAAVALLDMPVASRFTVDAVERRMVLRRQRIAWRDGDQITRARPSLVRLDRSTQHGGLVLRRGRRRYLLVDRAESVDEYDALVEVIDTAGEAVDSLDSSLLPRPETKTPPTWLYRRRHWRPDQAPDR